MIAETPTQIWQRAAKSLFFFVLNTRKIEKKNPRINEYTKKTWTSLKRPFFHTPQLGKNLKEKRGIFRVFSLLTRAPIVFSRCCYFCFASSISIEFWGGRAISSSKQETPQIPRSLDPFARKTEASWDSKGSFTHSIENAAIEASSRFHRSFNEFFVVMHEIFDDGINFS